MKQILFLDSASDDFVLYFILSVILLFIFILITRAIFSIGTRLKYQKAEFWLMIRLCQKQGVETEDIANILKDFEISGSLPGDSQREFIKQNTQKKAEEAEKSIGK